jgi:hypothetical protein
MVEDRLRGRAIPALEYGAIAKHYRLLASGRRKLADLIWAWLVLENWHDAWIRGQATAPIVPPEVSVKY